MARNVSLGIDAIWLSPTYPSPMKDFGYDISDYVAVHPDFGTMSDMEQLIAECHARGIRVLLDFVPTTARTNTRGSSIRGARVTVPSATGTTGAMRRRMVPRQTTGSRSLAVRHGRGCAHRPVLSALVPGGAAGPELAQSEVVAAVHDVLRFWLDRGIDGFRIDVIGMVLKHPELADNPPDPEWRPHLPEYRRLLQLNSRNYPDVIDAVRGIRRVLDEYEGRVAVGEVFGTAEQIAWYYGATRWMGYIWPSTSS